MKEVNDYVLFFREYKKICEDYDLCVEEEKIVELEKRKIFLMGESEEHQVFYVESD